MLSQITGQFRQLSRLTGLQSLLGAAAVLLLWLLKRGEECSRLYLLLYTAGNVLTTGIWLFNWRTLFAGKAAPAGRERRATLLLIRTGVPLMLANLCTLLILSADRQCVSLMFDTRTYAVYAFAYNILTMITMVISAISTVLFPTMKRMERDALLQAWPTLCLGVPLLVFACTLVYYPLVPFIRRFLPDYAASLDTLRIVFPGLAASSLVTIVIHNYDKALGLSDRFCAQSLLMLLLSIAANIAAWRLFGSTAAISGASVIMLLLWYLLTGGTLHRRYGLRLWPGLLLLLGGSGLYWLCTMELLPLWAGFLLQLAVLLLSSMRIFRPLLAARHEHST